MAFSKIAFSKIYGDIIQPFVQKFNDATNQKGKKGVLKNAALAVKEHRNNLEDKGPHLPKELETVSVVFSFYSLITHVHFVRQSADILHVVVRRKKVQKSKIILRQKTLSKCTSSGILLIKYILDASRPNFFHLSRTTGVLSSAGTKQHCRRL